MRFRENPQRRLALARHEHEVVADLEQGRAAEGDAGDVGGREQARGVDHGGGEGVVADADAIGRDGGLAHAGEEALRGDEAAAEVAQELAGGGHGSEGVQGLGRLSPRIPSTLRPCLRDKPRPRNKRHRYPDPLWRSRRWCSPAKSSSSCRL